MRVTAGRFKGRQIKTVKSNDVRPTLSKIRESIFNMIQDQVSDARMLDLFAGSGIMGLELISRGGKEVVFIEKNPLIVKTLRENLKNFDFEYSIYLNDALKALDKLAGNKFDIIFVDPPYLLGLIPEIIQKIKNNSLLSNSGIIILEHPTKFNFDETIQSNGFEIYKNKTYGDTAITMLKGY
jgi:16S rRNA (guanine(966)-N(2))-methyltransferase RsmD